MGGGVAKKLSGIRVQKVSSHNLGVITRNAEDVSRNFLMIERFTALPCEIAKRFATRYDNQASVEVTVMEGGTMEDDDTCDPMDSNKIGEAVLENIPPYPRGSPIEITYRYDESGILTVHAKDLVSGKAITASIKHPGGLSESKARSAGTTRNCAASVR